MTRADPQFIKSVATVRVRLLVFVARRDRAGLYALFMYNYRFGSRFSETRPLFLLMTKATRKLYISPTSHGLCRVRALRTMRGKNAFQDGLFFYTFHPHRRRESPSGSRLVDDEKSVKEKLRKNAHVIVQSI